jgi:hypothetical protein
MLKDKIKKIILKKLNDEESYLIIKYKLNENLITLYK